jgi:hypothetical protein
MNENKTIEDELNTVKENINAEVVLVVFTDPRCRSKVQR